MAEYQGSPGVINLRDHGTVLFEAFNGNDRWSFFLRGYLTYMTGGQCSYGVLNLHDRVLCSSGDTVPGVECSYGVLNPQSVVCLRSI
jgi:hypothetical protein